MLSPASARRVGSGRPCSARSRWRSRCGSPAARGMTTSGKLTEWRMLPSLEEVANAASATIAAQFSSASPVEAPRCGRADDPRMVLAAGASGSRSHRRASLPGVERARRTAVTIDDAVAREIEQHSRACASVRSALRIHERAGLRRERRVQRHDVGAREHVIEAHRLLHAGRTTARRARTVSCGS